MIFVRKTHTVFSSSWSRRKQAEMLDEWQNQTLGAQIAANQLRHRIAVDIESRPESENVGSFGVNAKPLSGQFFYEKEKHITESLNQKQIAAKVSVTANIQIFLG